MKKPSPLSRSGRFAQGPAAEVARFSESVSFDWRLWRHDLLGSMAHATMLRRVGLLTPREHVAIVRALDDIGQEIGAGKFRWRTELEDVHMNIEAALTQRVPAGAKLHTGRSRNDQVALDLRLWLRDALRELDQDLRRLQRALVNVAAANAEVIIPGYTHLQRAQPVYLAHHLLAYVEMFERDHERLGDCFGRVNVCPLGSAALGGTTLPLDRAFVARQLGFIDSRGRPRLSPNSMDAVADRDFVVEFCATGALLAVHLSRLAEDIVLWSSREFDFVHLSDAYTTGSSLMPQKRNPDVAELTRGKSGRVIGNVVATLTLLKGLPLTYNRDLQEDKERLFDTADTVSACVRLMTGLVTHAQVNVEACRVAASDPLLLATDLVDRLVARGAPFRDAHHAVGLLVAHAEAQGVSLTSLSPQQCRKVHPLLQLDPARDLDLPAAMRKRRLPGSSGTAVVQSQIKRWTQRLQ